MRSIGRGGEAVLYLAELKLAGTAEPVVVKVLDSRRTLTPDALGRISAKWSEQAELLRFVNRLGVVGVREHFEGPVAHRAGQSGAAGGRALYLVMNHVDGVDLHDWRADRPMNSPAERREAMRCLEQLAEVLDHLHSGSATPSGRVVVHGDLSPGNIMVDTDGQATLVDFGLSKLTADHHTAEVWFTPGYAAPEVFEGRRTPATDRYAFGAIAYFLLSGDTPPPQAEELRTAFLALPFLTGPAAPDTVQREKMAALFSADPLHRPASLTGWVRLLRRAAGTTAAAASGAQRTQRTAEPVPPQEPEIPPLASGPKTPRRRRSRIVVGILLATILANSTWYAVERLTGSGTDGGERPGNSAAPSAGTDGARPPQPSGAREEGDGGSGPAELKLTGLPPLDGRFDVQRRAGHDRYEDIHRRPGQ
nr:protein kinase [Streptomyces sp. SID4919]